jgi:hypothetical protein
MLSWPCCDRVIAVDVAVSWLSQRGFCGLFLSVVALIRCSKVASLLSNLLS